MTDQTETSRIVVRARHLAVHRGVRWDVMDEATQAALAIMQHCKDYDMWARDEDETVDTWAQIIREVSRATL